MLCVLVALRKAIRRREIWVEGGNLWRIQAVPDDPYRRGPQAAVVDRTGWPAARTYITNS